MITEVEVVRAPFATKNQRTERLASNGERVSSLLKNLFRDIFLSKSHGILRLIFVSKGFFNRLLAGQ